MWKARHIQTGEIVTGSWQEIAELDVRIWTKWEVQDNRTRNTEIVAYPVIPDSKNGVVWIADKTPVVGNLAHASWSFPAVVILDRITRKLADPWLGDSFGYPSL